MADKAAVEEPTAKPKGSKVKKLLMGLIFASLLGGGGAAGGFYAAGVLGEKEEGNQEDPNKPKLLLKDGSTVSDTKATTPSKTKMVAAPSTANKFKVSYHQIEAPFTTNLRDSSSFAQISLAISTYYDARVVKNIEDHEIAIRSVILMALADQDRSALETQSGKETLQKNLTVLINAVLEEKAGFGGIDSVYFTNFVVQ